MKKLFLLTALALVGAACMLEPVPQAPRLGEVRLPIAAQPDTLWVSADYQGKPLLIAVMGSWCPYCKMSIPALNAVAQAYGDKIEVVGAFVDEDPQTVAEVAKAHDMQVKALYNGGELAQYLQAEGFPHMVLFDKNHRLVKKWEGFSPNREQDFRLYLDKLTK